MRALRPPKGGPGMRLTMLRHALGGRRGRGQVESGGGLLNRSRRRPAGSTGDGSRQGAPPSQLAGSCRRTRTNKRKGEEPGGGFRFWGRAHRSAWGGDPHSPTQSHRGACMDGKKTCPAGRHFLHWARIDVNRPHSMLCRAGAQGRKHEFNCFDSHVGKGDCRGATGPKKRATLGPNGLEGDGERGGGPGQGEGARGAFSRPGFFSKMGGAGGGGTPAGSGKLWAPPLP